MMQHLTTNEIIDYLHNGLTPQADAGAYAHLESCAQCRSECDAEAALTEMLRSQAAAQTREFPATLKAQIWSRIRSEKPSLATRLAQWFRPAVSVPAAAALALAAYFGTVYLGPHGGTSIAATYYLQDHEALNGTVPFADHNAISPVEMQEAAMSSQQSALTIQTAAYTADANP